MPDERIDIHVLLDEIQEEVRRLRAEGKINHALERKLDLHLRPDIPPPLRRREVRRMRATLVDTEYRTSIDHDVTAASERLLGGTVKRGVKALVGWYVGAVTAQVREFAAANLRTMRAIADAVREVEGDLSRLESRLDTLESELRERSAEPQDHPRGPIDTA